MFEAVARGSQAFGVVLARRHLGLRGPRFPERGRERARVARIPRAGSACARPQQVVDGCSPSSPAAPVGKAERSSSARPRERQSCRAGAQRQHPGPQRARRAARRRPVSKGSSYSAKTGGRARGAATPGGRRRPRPRPQRLLSPSRCLIDRRSARSWPPHRMRGGRSCGRRHRAPAAPRRSRRLRAPRGGRPSSAPARSPRDRWRRARGCVPRGRRRATARAG